MAWSAMVPTQPPDVQAMLKDQTNRWNKVYANMPQPAAPEEQFDWDSLMNSGMFFTGQGNDPAEEYITGRNRNPFMWGTGNDSLEDAYRATYDAYYKDAPSATTSYYDTWEGPEIRAIMGEAGENPTYWQDNNQDNVLTSGVDDTYVPTGNEGNTVSNARAPTINIAQPVPEQTQQPQQGGLQGMFGIWRNPDIWDEETVWDISSG